MMLFCGRGTISEEVNVLVHLCGVQSLYSHFKTVQRFCIENGVVMCITMGSVTELQPKP